MTRFSLYPEAGACGLTNSACGPGDATFDTLSFVLGAGSRVAHYLIEGHLGHGGMGEVYAAFDERLERRVALKFLPAERVLDMVARGRMLREARAASALKHPGIVTIYEIGEAEGRTYIAMELIEGDTLAQFSGRRGPLAPAEAVDLARQIGDALSVAHEAGILHRDVKTANLMIDARGRVKVLDFGLSKRVAGTGPASSPPLAMSPSPDPSQTLPDHEGRLVDPAAPTALPQARPSPTPVTRPLGSSDPVTIHGERMGTPGSAALELMRGEEADRRSDVFSLGVVLYELLCGRRPFRGADLSELLDNLGAERYPPAGTINPAVNAELDAVLARALRASREDRFDTVSEMVAAAESAIEVAGPAGEALAVAPVPAPAPAPRTTRRVVAIAGSALALGTAGAVWALATNRPAEPRSAAPADGGPAALPADRIAAGPPRALTRLGGCAYAPTFADERTVVFDLTDLAGENHLWSVPVAGGEARQLTRGPLTEWRATPGRHPGEVVYLVSNPASNTGEGAGIAALDLASGRVEKLTSRFASSAAYSGDSLYYLERNGSGLRRLRAGVDELAANWTNDITAKMMDISRDGRWVAIMSANPGPPRICLIDLPAVKIACPKSERMINARPAFSVDGQSVYYPGVRGIGRLYIEDSPDDLVVPGLRAPGGLTVAPDGAHLAYSDCVARSAMVEVAPGEKPRTLTSAGSHSEPGAGPGDSVAYVSSTPDGPVLLLRAADGTIRQLAGPLPGRASQPRFSRDGRRVAFVVGGKGLFVEPVESSQTLPPTQMTDRPADEDPAWLPDGRLLFTRREGQPPGAYIVDPAGGQPRPLESVPRRVVGVLARGDVMLLSVDSTQFVEWDFRKHRERRSKVSIEKLGRLVGFAMSPDGRWLGVQTGEQGNRVYRFDLSAAKPRPELAFEAQPGQTVGRVALTNRGHVLALPETWSGEIYAIDAVEGGRF